MTLTQSKMLRSFGMGNTKYFGIRNCLTTAQWNEDMEYGIDQSPIRQTFDLGKNH